MWNKRGVITVTNSTTEIMDEVFEDTCRDVVDPYFEAKCTSGVEGNHSIVPESGHGYGRSKDYGFEGRHVTARIPIPIPISKRQTIVTNCQRKFDVEWGKNEFRILLEKDHFHVQRKKGSV